MLEIEVKRKNFYILHKILSQFIILMFNVPNFRIDFIFHLLPKTLQDFYVSSKIYFNKTFPLQALI